MVTKNTNRAALIAELKKETARLDKNLIGMKAYRDANIIEFFDTPPSPGPNPRQKDILEAWLDPFYKTFVMSGGNRLGKCLVYSTPVCTTKGDVPIGELYEKNEPFTVYAWDGEKKVPAKASPPFQKNGVHRCYRIEMEDGQWVEAADHHRILTSWGWISVERLAKFFPSLQDSSLELSPLTRVRDDSHLSRKASDYQGHCFEDYDRYGGRPLFGQDTFPALPPLQDDAQIHNYYLFGSDALENKRTNTLSCPDSDHLSILDALAQIGVQFFESLFHAFCRFLKPFDFGNQFSAQSTYVSSPQLRPNDGFGLPANHDFSGESLSHASDTTSISGIDSLQDGLRPTYESFFPLQSSNEFSQSANFQADVQSFVPPFKVIGTNNIKSITSIDKLQPVYDFEVQKYHNYFAGGLIHHNTTILTLIGLSTMFGKYLWNNQSLLHLFNHNKPRKIRYIGQSWQEHITQVVIPELQKWWPGNRIVKKHGNGVIRDTFWLDEQTGSTLEVMSNSQDSNVHEGWSGDLVLYDEPCKEEIYIANARGLVDRRGRECFAATLLTEPWIDQKIVKKRLSDGTPDRRVFAVSGHSSDNVGYGITQEGLDDFADKLTATSGKDTIEARLSGKPSYLSGLICGEFNRNIHLKKRFRVPLDYIVDISIDFHPRERQAILFMATDRRQDRYVVEEIWDHGDAKWIAESILLAIAHHKYRVNRIIIDPLAKGDSNNPETVYEIIANILLREELILEVASKDKDHGILEINNHLKGPNDTPSMFFFDDLPETLFEIEGWMWEKETNKAIKRDDHMMENLYRLCLLNTQYYPPEDEDEYPQYNTGKFANDDRDAMTGY